MRQYLFLLLDNKMEGNQQSMPAANPAPAKSGSGLTPNLAGALAYLFGIFSGVFFLATEKNDKFIKFHAWQSIMFTVVYIIAWFVASIIPTALGALVSMIVGIAAFVGWIYLMYQAYSGKEYKLPYIGEMAMEQASK